MASYGYTQWHVGRTQKVIPIPPEGRPFPGHFTLWEHSFTLRYGVTEVITRHYALYHSAVSKERRPRGRWGGWKCSLVNRPYHK